MDEALLLVALLAPLIAALLTMLLAHKLGGGVGFLTPLSAAVSFVALLFASGASPGLQVHWLETAGFDLSVGLRLDGLSRFMALLVTGVALPVGVYAAAEMAKEDSRSRFFATLSFFLCAMLTLVLADSFILLFAAWEAVGVASFLLIGFWYRQEAARSAAFNAFLITRCGDMGLLLGWLLALLLVGSSAIDALLRAAHAGNIPAAMQTLLALLFLAGAIGKSAQVPLTSWLPDAMVGPTPVSALIHSATMVAAGVYLLLRLFPLFAATPPVLLVVLVIGMISAFVAALIAAGQNDLKRVLAWSTASHLGEMMTVVGLGGPLAAAFHLGSHAAFKSTLFLAAGAVDDGAGTRHMSRLGRLGRTMPVTTLVFFAGALALAGVPPFSGFWSEEAILSRAVMLHPLWGVLLLVLVTLAGAYIGRAAVAVFFPWPGSPAPKVRDPDAARIWAMTLLAMAALGLGWLLSGRLESLVQFSSSDELSWSWRLAEIAAGFLGLGIGGGRVLRYGPVPAFGALSEKLEEGLYAATSVPAAFVRACARAVARLEKWLDGGAQALARAAFASAKAEERVEAGFDFTGRELAAEMIELATTVDIAERRGFSAVLDRFGVTLVRGSGRLRMLQSGKSYLYTLGVFLWILCAGLLGFLAWSCTASG